MLEEYHEAREPVTSSIKTHEVMEDEKIEKSCIGDEEGVRLHKIPTTVQNYLLTKYSKYFN